MSAEKPSIIVSLMTSDKGCDAASPKNCNMRNPKLVVLDSNVVLDWLVFDDPSMRLIAATIAAGRWRWTGTAATLQELATVLCRPGLEAWCDRLEPALAQATSLCSVVPAPTTRTLAHLRCTDSDDQKFIDLAVAQRAALLFTRDKALLRLARRARDHGLVVLRPVDWAPTQA
jgi:uncharacterized protein